MRAFRLIRLLWQWVWESLELALRSRSPRTGLQFALNAALLRLGSPRRFHRGGRRFLRREGILFAFDSWDGLLTVRKNYELGIRSAVEATILDEGTAAGTFIAIGAHIGRHALGFAHRFDTTIAIEPTPSSAALLLESVRRNRLDHQVRVIAAACAECDDRLLPFRVIAADSKNHVAFGGRSSFLVPSVSVDGVVRSLGLKRVALMLIDAEGAEESVLRGARATLHGQRPHVIVETLGPSQSARVDAILAPLGYRGTPIDGHNTHYRPSRSH